jgi:hypothetical protein
VFGVVSGQGDYVSIVAGVIEVLLSNNATYLKKSTTADKYTYDDIFNALANRYIKTETYSQDEIDALLAGLTASYGLQSTLLTPTPLTDTDTLTTADMSGADFVVLTAINSATGEVDSDMVSSDSIVTGKKFVFFDSEDYTFTIGATDSTFSTTSTDVTLKVNAISSNVSIIQPLTSVTTEPVTAEDGDKYFNSSTSTIWEYETDTWVDSGEEPDSQKIYTFDGAIYIWTGSTLIEFESDLSGYIEADGTNSAISELTFVDGESETELGAGKARYNNGAWEFGLDGGTYNAGEEVYQKIKAIGSAINNGQPYYTDGSSGENAHAYLANRNDHAKIGGLATENITENAVGRGTVFGYVNNVDTTGTLSGALAETWADGNVLWLTDVDGQLSNVEPTNGDIKVRMGKVIFSHATTGTIEVCVRVFLPHNEVAGIQGGTTDEYYHLTEDEHTTVGYVRIDSYSNTSLGIEATTGGLNNVGIGRSALQNNSGDSNTAVGRYSLSSNTDGDRNTAIGQSSLIRNTTGEKNIAVGYQAGVDTSEETNNETGSNNIFIGSDTKPNANGDTNEIVIGHEAVGEGSNTVVLGNDSITDTYLKGTVHGIQLATTTEIGGIKADTLTDEDVEVKINATTGKLYVPTYPTDTGEDNVIEEVQIDSSALTVTDKAVNIPMATTAVKGVVTLSDAEVSGDLGTSDAVITETVLGIILPEKVTANDAITGATKAKITYDAKGLVTAGADLARSDIPTAVLYPPTNTQDANYTLVLADDGKVILAGHATNAVKVTIPLNSSVEFPTNTEIAIVKYLAGDVTIGTSSGATLNGEASTTTFEITDQYGTIAIKKIGTDAWIMTGGFEEVA